MKNTSFHTHEVKKCCEKKLEIEFRTGKEFNGWFRLDNKKAARITIPKGRKPVPPKTYISMAKQLKLTVDEFDGLLECPVGKEEYRNILKKRLSPPAQRR